MDRRTHLPVIFMVSAVLLAVAQCTNNELSVYNDVVVPYKQNNGHKVKPEGPTEVEFSMTLQNIASLDETTGLVTVLVWFNEQWTIPELTWSPAEYGGVDTIRVSPQDVWMPDIYLYNSYDPNMDVSSDVQITVFSDGRVYYIPPARLRALCDTEQRRQRDVECQLKFGSWTYDGSKLNVTVGGYSGGVDTTTYSENPTWNLVSAEANRNVMVYECCPEPYIDITVNLHLRRRTF